MERINEIIDRYFEGTLSEGEEARLKVFLASPEGQASEYDEVRAVMGYFAVGRSLASQPMSKSKGRWLYTFTNSPALWRRVAAVAASLALLITIGINIYNKENICVSFVGGQKVTDKEVVMNDVDNILADLLADRMDMEEQLVNIFGE